MLPAKGKSFDPTKIPQAVRKAGFTPGEIQVTAVGILRDKNTLLLEMPGPPSQFLLAGGAKADELRGRRDLLGKRVRINGKLHPSHAERVPGLTVEQWTVLDDGR